MLTIERYLKNILFKFLLKQNKSAQENDKLY